MKKYRTPCCILLCFALLLGMFPAPARAADNVVTTHDADQIRALLRRDGDVAIRLDGDADKQLTAYSDLESYQTVKWNGNYVWARLGSGSKTVDLNGHRLYVYDQSARSLGTLEWPDFRYIQKALLMEIPTGASLTVNDSGDGGMIRMDAEMPPKGELRGNGMIMERNTFAVTGGSLVVNGGEIHAGRSKDIYANQATEYDKYYDLIPSAGIGYKDLCGYATWFLSGTAVTAVSGSVTVNGGELWGRGWDNFAIISRVPGEPNGADDHRDRCAALRAWSGSRVHIASGGFYGRSDADAVQVSEPGSLTVESGVFDVGTNTWLVIPGLDLSTIGAGGSITQILDDWGNVAPFDVHEGYTGSFGVPEECIDEQSVQVIRGDTMTISKNAVAPYKVIDTVNLYLNAPVAGKERAESAGDIFGVPDGADVQSVTWYQNGREWVNAGSGGALIFHEGDSYSVRVALRADVPGGTKFKNRLTDATINGKDAAVTRDGDLIALTVDFGACPAALASVTLTVVEPLEGAYPSSWVGVPDEAAYYPCGGYSDYAEYRRWYVSDDGEDGWAEMDSEETFAAGKYYRFSVEIAAAEDREFSVDAGGVSVQPDITATVNGKNTAVSKAWEQDPARQVTVTRDFGKCPVRVDWVELTATAPKDGEAVRYTAASQAENCAVLTGEDNVRWYQSDTGYDGWTEMSRGSTFAAEKYYKLQADVWAKGGYEFPTYSDGVSIQPGASATVNGYGANVFRMYGQEPSRYITVEYFFGCCNDSVIENIVVENVTPPVAGEKPSYVYSISGSGYQMNTAFNSYDESTGQYRVKNGLQWWDVTTGSWDYVYENDVFVPGRRYACQLYLIAEDGFHFRNKSEHSALPTATVNGNAAEINEGWTSATEARVFYTFTCERKEVSAVVLGGLDFPQAGETPDTDVTSAEPDVYTAKNVRWLDAEGRAVSGFEEGLYYTVEITVASQKSGGADFCAFASPVSAYIDGMEVAGRNSSVVTNNDNTVTIRYSFARPACAPKSSAFLSASLSGTTLTWNALLPSTGRSATVISAWYSVGGRLLGVTTDTVVASGEAGGTLTVPADAARYKLMIVDTLTAAPLCPAWSCNKGA